MCSPSTGGEVCTRDGGPEISLEKPVQIRMVWSENSIDIYVDSASPVFSMPAVARPTRAHFSMYADDGSAFRVSVDDVFIEYG